MNVSYSNRMDMKGKILIVEDEAIMAMLIRNIFNQLGKFDSEIVASGEKAVSSVARSKPDLVVMDIQLSGMIDGIDAAYGIKKQCDIPIIFLTAFSNQEILERAKPLNPLSYLIKPITIPEFVSVIKPIFFES